MVVGALAAAGLDIVGLTLERAEGGRAQLYRADSADGSSVFVKVYAQDSRDADLLYRGYRALLLRGPNDDWPTMSLQYDVEHESLLLLLARRAGVTCPAVEAITKLEDGSMVLAMEHVDGVPLDSVPPEAIDAELLDATWNEVARLHEARLAHRSLRAANVMVADRRPVLIDLGFAKESATNRGCRRSIAPSSSCHLPRSQAWTASSTPPRASSRPPTSPRRCLTSSLWRCRRRRASRARRRCSATCATGIATATDVEAEPLERLVRVRPRTLLMIAVIVGAFYFLLPQLADVGDSFTALRSANYWWLAVCFLMSMLTYVASAIGLAGGVPGTVAVRRERRMHSSRRRSSTG